MATRLTSCALKRWVWIVCVSTPLWVIAQICVPSGSVPIWLPEKEPEMTSVGAGVSAKGPSTARLAARREDRVYSQPMKLEQLPLDAEAARFPFTAVQPGDTNALLPRPSLVECEWPRLPEAARCWARTWRWTRAGPPSIQALPWPAAAGAAHHRGFAELSFEEWSDDEVPENGEQTER